MSEARHWYAEQKRHEHLDLNQCDIAESSDWFMDDVSIRRHDGCFFSVVGIEVHDALRPAQTHKQPLIHQPEVGVLGFILSRGPLGMQILVQAKPEPGNTPVLQLAPSVQATVSNYERRHGGAPTAHLSHFTTSDPASVLSNTVQSEQGTRFLGKYNRNITLLLPESLRPQASGSTRWLLLDELLEMLGDDFTINTDARSVLATTPWRYLARHERPFARPCHEQPLGQMLDDSYRALHPSSHASGQAHLASLYALRQSQYKSMRTVPIHQLADWQATGSGLKHRKHALSIQHVRVWAPSREIHCWDQPLFASAHQGLCVLLCQWREGALHFLFTARDEPGFWEGAQYGPTLQSGDPDTEELMYPHDGGEADLKDAVASSTPLMSCLQSDEGGRFYRCITRYELRLLSPGQACETPVHCQWMTLHHIEQLLPLQGLFTNEARTLISMLLVHV